MLVQDYLFRDVTVPELQMIFFVYDIPLRLDHPNREEQVIRAVRREQAAEAVPQGWLSPKEEIHWMGDADL